MAQFKNLSSAINIRVLQAQARAQSISKTRSASGIESNVIKINPDSFEDERNILRWGFSTWGVEKVTSEYKPVK
jgi:hypothetical protein